MTKYDNELPLGKRTLAYRVWEMVPGLLSYGAVFLLIVLSLLNPLFAAIYLLLIIVTMAVKAIGIAVHTIAGRNLYERAQVVDWHERLGHLEEPARAYQRLNKVSSNEFGYRTHLHNLHSIINDVASHPKPSDVYHVVIIATYNESFEILDTTLQSLLSSTYDKNRMIIVLTYEERGGPTTHAAAKKLQQKYHSFFHSFLLNCHPEGLPDEVIGKGPNITHAGFMLKQWLYDQKIAYKDVIVTTLDSDNRPYPTYFDYVAYEFIVRPDRKQLSYQPIALYFGNIWDAPAPMRVIATGNSFWTIISSMRPHTLRNFAAHSQPMDALVEMNFWSKRSIVEDGHQYWRSYFHFHGNYEVVPIHVPIYQDAVLAATLKKTLVAQFKQLRRWGYGASDVPYVATRVFSRHSTVPVLPSIARLIRLVDSHVTLASTAILVTVGGWVPLILSHEAARDIAAHQLPEVVSMIQRIAMVGLFITIFLSMKMLPMRPARYKRHRTVGMVLQWLLMPVTSIIYSSFASFNAQTHLLIGRYLDTFDVTDKSTITSIDLERPKKKNDRGNRF